MEFDLVLDSETLETVFEESEEQESEWLVDLADLIQGVAQ